MSKTLSSVLLALALATTTLTTAAAPAKADEQDTRASIVSSAKGVESAVAATVVDVVAGDMHSCALMSTGIVRCWGYNYWGQLGNGSNANSLTPVDVIGLSNVTAIAAGSNHTCALQSNGGVRCWGYNSYGQLGDGTLVDRNSQVRVISLGGIGSRIAAGYYHSCVVLTTGVVRCWGLNNSYQLGTGDQVQHTSPITASVLSGSVAEVATGLGHTCVLMQAGGVECWGENSQGQLGNGGWSSLYQTPQPTQGLNTGVVKVFARFQSSCALLITGSMRCWGTSPLGNKAVPYQIVGLANSVTSATTGGTHYCAVFMKSLVCWGSSGSGQLGNGQTTMSYPNPTQVFGLTQDVERVAAGNNHTCAVVRGGVMCWGDNSWGQVGDGTTQMRTTPVAVTGLEPAPEPAVECTTEGFDVVAPSGWSVTNNSQPAGITDWFQGDTGYFPAQSGATNSYAAANIDNTAGEGTISNWLISPPMTVTNGDRVSFWTRKVSPDTYPDRLQVRLSQAGASLDVGSIAESVGDFTTLVYDIDPGLGKNTYPTTWFPFTFTLGGITGTVTGRLAFRYYVTSGGPGGTNSDYIGIDTFSHCVPLGPPATPTPTPTNTPSSTPTPNATETPTTSPTPSSTPTATATPTLTETPTSTPTGTASPAPTEPPTATDTPTAVATNTPEPTATPSPSALPTETPTQTSSPSSTPTNTESPTSTATPTDTDTPTPAPTSTSTETYTSTPTATPTNTETPTPTSTATPTTTPSQTATATATGTSTPAPTPYFAYLPMVIDEPTATPTQTSSSTSTLTLTRTPTVTPTLTPTSTPTGTPTATTTFTMTPTRTPTSTPTNTPTRTPTPTATLAPGVFVLNNSTTRPSSSYRYVTGEIYNNTPNHLQFVNVRVNFFDGAQFVATDYSYTPLYNVHPHEKVCFAIFLSNPPNWTSYSFEPVLYSTTGTSRPNLVITSQSGAPYSSSFYRVIGQIRNDESQLIKYVSAVATMYDASGKVVECNDSYVGTTDLNPGQVSSFDILGMPAMPGEVASYVLQTDGSR